MNTLEAFNKNVVKNLQKQLAIKNVNAVPKIDKVIVAIGIGSLATRKSLKDFDEFEKVILKITGQKSRVLKSKKAISNFKLRENMPVMLQTTLRKQKAYDFLDRFMKLVMPRLRDFSGFTDKAFDGQGNFNIGLPNYNIFPELSLDDIVTTMGLQITIVTTTKDNAHAKVLLQALGFIFK
ncbi:MAG: 50S ribosomal protein L5 [candidate division SR1 bacterium]|nr:50S ribosomal protein L5 [candidate division SR1 bacterium]